MCFVVRIHLFVRKTRNMLVEFMKLNSNVLVFSPCADQLGHLILLKNVSGESLLMKAVDRGDVERFEAVWEVTRNAVEDQQVNRQ